MIDYCGTPLPFHGTQVPVFQNLEMLRKEPLRVVVRADRALQAAACHQGAFGDVAPPNDHLPGIGGDAVGIAVEIAAHAVHHHRLVDVPADEPVVETFLVPVPATTRSDGCRHPRWHWSAAVILRTGILCP